ncbi:MAG: STAS domain-containing protein [Clostridia bacterium]|nr:STAS domain-containing protein [Clostridia bacterium]
MKPELFNSLKNYKKSYILNDLLAGLMVAIIALPLSIALGIQSVPEGTAGINGIQAGIITAIVAGFFISLLGGSKYQIGGPTAAFVVILFGYLADPEIGVLGLAIAGIMAGVILIVMGICRAGNVMKFFPYPITIGFTTGIGVTLMTGQLKDFLGLATPEEPFELFSEFISKIANIFSQITTFNFATFAVGLVGLSCVIILPKISKKIPSALVAIVLCTVVSLVLEKVSGDPVATIGSTYGEIQASFSFIDISTIKEINFAKLIVPAIVIAFLCAIESLLSATVASGMTGTKFNANQELVGQGVANIFSSLFGGLPATGAIARTAASIENGAKSPLAGVFHAVFILIMYFLLMGVVGYIPLAVFAAILISVAINMARFPLFIRLASFGVRDSIVMLVTFTLTVIFDLTYGVIGGVIVCVLANIPNFKNGARFETEFSTVYAHGTLFFGNASKLPDFVNREMADRRQVTIDLSGVERIDETALEKLSNLKKVFELQERELTFVNANPAVQRRLDRYLGKI